MALVRPGSDSLSQLVDVFQDKTEHLQKLVLLLGSDGVNDAFLNQAEGEVRALEMCLDQVKQNITAGQDFVAKGRELVRALENQQSKANLLEQHLPSHLQKAKSPALKRSASHLEEKLPVQVEPKSSKAAVKITISPPTPAVFEAVPKYVKNRLSYDKLIEVCESLSNALTEKYKILATKPTALSDAALRKFKVFKEQECEATDGFKFLSTAEFKLLDLLLDASTKAALGTLKHTNAIKVDATGGVTRYLYKAGG